MRLKKNNTYIITILLEIILSLIQASSSNIPKTETIRYNRNFGNIVTFNEKSENFLEIIKDKNINQDEDIRDFINKKEDLFYSEYNENGDTRQLDKLNWYIKAQAKEDYKGYDEFTYAVKLYTAFNKNSALINDYLRYNRINENQYNFTEKDIKPWIYILYNALINSEKYSRYSNYKVKNDIVYRGIHETIPSEWEVGMKFFFAEFVSTSKSREEAERRKDGTLLIITLKNNGVKEHLQYYCLGYDKNIIKINCNCPSGKLTNTDNTAIISSNTNTTDIYNSVNTVNSDICNCDDNEPTEFLEDDYISKEGIIDQEEDNDKKSWILVVLGAVLLLTYFAVVVFINNN